MIEALFTVPYFLWSSWVSPYQTMPGVPMPGTKGQLLLAANVKAMLFSSTLDMLEPRPEKSGRATLWVENKVQPFNPQDYSCMDR